MHDIFSFLIIVYLSIVAPSDAQITGNDKSNNQ